MVLFIFNYLLLLAAVSIIIIGDIKSELYTNNIWG